MRLPSTAQHDRLYIRRSPGTGEVQRAKHRSVHGVCRPDESFRHNQQGWFMADTTKDWLPWPVCWHHTVIRRRDDGPSTRSRTNVRAILGNKLNGSKKGCVMSPLLFTLVFSAMLNDAFHDNDLGALIRFRTDGDVFKLRRLNSKTRTSMCWPEIYFSLTTVHVLRTRSTTFKLLPMLSPDPHAVSDWRSVWRK